MEFESSCYEVFTDEIKGTDAKTVCTANSHLVYIETEDEQDFLEERLKDKHPDTDFWIGLTEYVDEDLRLWEWLDGSALPYWRSVPSDSDGPCFRMRRGSDYAWDDKNCNDDNGIICEGHIGR